MFESSLSPFYESIEGVWINRIFGIFKQLFLIMTEFEL